jgi:superfamily II DNA/RNA helicase
MNDASSTPTMPSFDSLGLPARLVSALARLEITTPTPVQAAVLPDAMAGNDVLGRAQTGSGKTLAFGLPILARLAGTRSRPKHPRALIIVPTRELATQVRRSLEPLAEAMRLKLTTVYGGTPYERQIRQLRNGADIVVATPGRLEDLIARGSCRTDDVEVTVLDEADHLCDLGFYPVVDALVSETPEGSQRLLLSATLDGDVDRLVRTHLRDPQLHELDANESTVTTMAHHVLVVGGYRDKVAAATALVEANPRSIVFTRTREGATELADSLTESGIEAVDLHGNLSQRVRERNLHTFSSGKAQVVVATDVAARGIHVDNVGLVVHYDAPTDAKAYLHRSGRTARAGESGTVVTITTPRQVDEIVRLQSRAGVDSRHHDIRTAPRPMTAEALAGSGEDAPTSRSGGRRSGDSRGGYQGRGGARGGYRGRTDRRDERDSFKRDSYKRDSFQRDSFPGTGRADRNDRPDRGTDRPARFDRTDRGPRSDRYGRPDRDSRTERTDRADRFQRSDRPDRSDRSGRPERADRFNNGERGDRFERSDRPGRSDRRERTDRYQPSAGAGRGERSDRSDRSDRGGRPDRPRYDRGNDRRDDRRDDRTDARSDRQRDERPTQRAPRTEWSRAERSERRTGYPQRDNASRGERPDRADRRTSENSNGKKPRWSQTGRRP